MTESEGCERWKSGNCAWLDRSGALAQYETDGRLSTAPISARGRHVLERAGPTTSDAPPRIILVVSRLNPRLARRRLVVAARAQPEAVAQNIQAFVIPVTGGLLK